MSPLEGWEATSPVEAVGGGGGSKLQMGVSMPAPVLAPAPAAAAVEGGGGDGHGREGGGDAGDGGLSSMQTDQLRHVQRIHSARSARPPSAPRPAHTSASDGDGPLPPELPSPEGGGLTPLIISLLNQQAELVGALPYPNPNPNPYVGGASAIASAPKWVGKRPASQPSRVRSSFSEEEAGGPVFPSRAARRTPRGGAAFVAPAASVVAYPHPPSAPRARGRPSSATVWTRPVCVDGPTVALMASASVSVTQQPAGWA